MFSLTCGVAGMTRFYFYEFASFFQGSSLNVQSHMVSLLAWAHRESWWKETATKNFKDSKKFPGLDHLQSQIGSSGITPVAINRQY